MSEDDNKIPNYKIVLIGETAVGKTSLISRYVKNTFIDNFVPTLGGGFVTKKIKIEHKNNQEIKLDIWDTAGQEKYRSVAQMFYKDASACILVYDITRRDSFNEIRNFWFEEVKENSPENIVMALAGNKSDLYEYEDIEKDEVNSFAKNNNLIFKETSAKDNNGINELFELIGLKLLDPENYEYIMSDSKTKKVHQIRQQNMDKNEFKHGQALKNQGNKKKGGCC